MINIRLILVWMLDKDTRKLLTACKEMRSGPFKNKDTSKVYVHTHTHTHTHIYIYIYIYMCVCVCVFV